MRKNATKIAAMMLSLALTVTSVNVPTTSSAAAKVKLNKTKATLYVGGASAKKSTTLKATFNGKKVKATFTSSNSKVAKVAKNTGKVTAVKAGSATITAKYKSKKATCKITVKQYVTGITAPASIELTEGEIIDLSKQVTVKPANASNKTLSYVPDESYIAGVNKDGSILKGVKEGKTVVTIKAKDGSNKKATVVVNVKAKTAETPAPGETPNPGETPAPAKEAKNVSVKVTNPFDANMADTLLVGSNAEVKVQVTDADGNPVANKEVVLASKSVYEANSKYAAYFENLSDTVKTTDANGYVTFVFGLDKSKDDNNKAIDATRTDFVSSFKLTASVVGNTDVKASTDVKFAAINTAALTGVTVKRPGANLPYAALESTTNNSVTGLAINGVASTTDRNEQAVEFITSQQVSSAAKSHSVTLTSNLTKLGLVTPGTENASTDASDIKETIDFSTGKYSTYTTTTNWAKVIDAAKVSDLQYATVNFGKLSLSKYSRFVVQAYIVQDPANPTAAGKFQQIPLTDAGAYVVGSKTAKDFAVQIPIDANSGYLYVTAQVQSKGQVNLDENEGFTVKNVVGVRKKTASSVSNSTTTKISGVTVEWSKDADVSYTLDKDLPAGAIRTYLEGNAKYKDCSFQYRMPAFPRTGNAIITVLNSEKKAVAYYAVPTANEYDNVKKEYKNQNVLVDNTNQMYQISQDEALNFVGDVTVDANGDAVVDSQKTGITHVIGKISSTNADIKIDASNQLVYSSVNWNPIPNTTATPAGKTRTAGAALVGQQISLKAQLTDTNGNPVTTSGIGIKFKNDDTEITGATSTVDDASVVKVDTETNALGQAELTLVAGKPSQALGLSAVADGNKYNLKYVLGTTDVTADFVDLYWVDANMVFEPDANTTAKAETTFASPVVDTEGNLDITPAVNSRWAYETRTNGDLADVKLDGTLAGYSGVNISGLTVQTTTGADSVGTVSDIDNGKANVTSTKAGTTKLVNVLNAASIGKDVKFTFTGGNPATKEVPYVGTGVTTLDKKLTLSIEWTAGVPTAEIIIPSSLKADINTASVPVYVKVQDANGNVLKDKDVTLKVTGVGAVDGAATVKTDKDGIASFAVKPDTATAGLSSALTATVAGLNATYTSSIKWIDTSKLKDLEIEKVAYDYTAKTIKLTFSNEVYAQSVIAEQFAVTYDGVKQIVTGATVAGKTVTLNVPALTTVNAEADFTVTITDAAKKDVPGITYSFVSVDAQKLAKNVVTFTADGTIK